jgi:peptidoglycan/xylan/chitin deacetylase (PgdA/CDA1 family)
MVRLLNAISAVVIAVLSVLLGMTTANAQGIPILVYHRFDTEKAGPTTIRTLVFEKQMAWLTEHHYHFVSLHAAIDFLEGNSSAVDLPAVVITADDGHRSVYMEMFPVIQRYRIPVALFIYPSAISKASYALTWEQLRIMQQSGLVDIESHTYWHPNFQKEGARLSPDAYQAFVAVQLTRSKEVLAKQLNTKISMLAWPFGIYDPELEQAAARAGYRAAFAYTGGPAHPGCDLFAIPRIPVSDADQEARFASLIADSHAGAKHHE